MMMMRGIPRVVIGGDDAVLILLRVGIVRAMGKSARSGVTFAWMVV